MEWNDVDPKGPYGMKSYKFREFDMILCCAKHNPHYVASAVM